MSKRILVVQDQPDNRQIIRDMLAPTDYEITEAEDGQKALEAIANERPDLILMDRRRATPDVAHALFPRSRVRTTGQPKTRQRASC